MSFSRSTTWACLTSNANCPWAALSDPSCATCRPPHCSSGLSQQLLLTGNLSGFGVSCRLDEEVVSADHMTLLLSLRMMKTRTKVCLQKWTMTETWSQGNCWQSCKKAVEKGVIQSRRQQTKGRLAGDEGEAWARKTASANSDAVTPHLVCSLTCDQLVLQVSLPSL